MNKMIKSKSICEVSWSETFKFWSVGSLDTLQRFFKNNLILSDVTFDENLGVLSGVVEGVYETTDAALEALKSASADVLEGSWSINSMGELRMLQDFKGNLVESVDKLLLTSGEYGYKILKVEDWAKLIKEEE